MDAQTPIAEPALAPPRGLPPLENKAAHPEGGPVRSALDELAAAFAAFKETNDARIDRIEGRVDPGELLLGEHVDAEAALDAARTRLDRIALERARPPLAQPDARGPGTAHEHKAAFDLYVRAGESAGLKRLEAKALSAGSGPDGGYLVPDTIERTVLTRLGQVSPIRSIASVQAISGAQYKRAVSVGAPVTGWAAETAPRPETAAPALSEIAFPAMELYAMPAATQTLLDDAVVDLDAWLSAEVETAFAEQEGVAFVSGNGASRPRGFLSYDTVANAAWVPGKIGTVATGAAGAFPSASPGDVLFDLIYGLRAAYRQNAGFVMNRRTQSAIRKFKDSEGNYLWQPPLAAGRAATLVGFPVTEAEAMPDLAKDSLSVAFGDFRRGYLVVDRTGMRVLRDPYSAKPYVLFYTTRRVGGGVQDFDALKLLKFS